MDGKNGENEGFTTGSFLEDLIHSTENRIKSRYAGYDYEEENYFAPITA